MPAAATSIVGGSNYYSWNGQWNFTSSSHPGMWNPQKLALQPRAGLAYKIDDKTALRFGYALYIIPTEFEYSPAPPNSGAKTWSFWNPVLWHVGQSEHAVSIARYPQETFSNPYPAATNPLNPILGRSSGPQLVWADRLSSGIRRICRNPTTTGSTSRSSMNCRARSSFRELISSIWG